MESHAGTSDSPTGDVLSRSADDIQHGKADTNSAETYVKGLQDDQPAASSTDDLLVASLPTIDAGAAAPHAADAALLELLARHNFAGPVYEAFHEEMVQYGQRVCMGWIRTGKMHEKCAAKDRPVESFPEGVERRDRWELATDTAVEGAAMFRQKALIGGKWSPTGGASLSTFYIGACVLVYPTVYRRWLKARRELRQLLVTPRLPEDLHDGPERQVHQRMLVQQLRRTLGDRDLTVLELYSQGYTYAAIGERIGASDKAVDGYLQRAKAKARLILEQSGGLDD